DILKPVDALSESGIVAMVRHHHERFDGKGYPCGLKEEAIPLGARIITLADSLSAMLQHRPYREARRFESAVAEIINCSGTQFDTRVVSALLEIKDEICSILSYLNPDPAFSDPIS
ncbi:MAG: HD domain-containing protein, partial [Desulfobacterales bacterium]|nr:HD domain-containing protein [Desulfobacterales bacterium]